MLRRLVIICLVMFLFISLAGCENAQGNFNQVHLGMARAEVVKIMGEPQEKEIKTLGSWTGEVLRWRFQDQTVVLMFTEDRVSGKQMAGPARKAQDS
jgi:hypothetical protein